jgi:hypothetical protein
LRVPEVEFDLIDSRLVLQLIRSQILDPVLPRQYHWLTRPSLIQTF